MTSIGCICYKDGNFYSFELARNFEPFAGAPQFLTYKTTISLQPSAIRSKQWKLPYYAALLVEYVGHLRCWSKRAFGNRHDVGGLR